MQRKKSFVVVLAAVVFGLAANAQTTQYKLAGAAPSDLFLRGNGYPTPKPQLLTDPSLARTQTLAAQVFATPHGLPTPADPTSTWFSMHYAVLFPMDFYARNMGIVCQKEWKFEKATGIPLRIRLGSLEQCNRLEGKN